MVMSFAMLYEIASSFFQLSFEFVYFYCKNIQMYITTQGFLVFFLVFCKNSTIILIKTILYRINYCYFNIDY